MRKNIMKTTAVSAAAALVLAMTGCGGGGDGTPASSTTGTGYYLDNAVAGVDYVCGNQSGVTGIDGNFTFEVGKDCTFSLANTVLRKVNAANLINNVKIVENNITVATFLQSIDDDGDLNNGIQISTDVRKALSDAFKTEGIKGVPYGHKLDAIVSKLDQNVTNFGGFVHTEAEAEAHVKNTQTNVVKEMLAGKKFYIAGQSTQNKTDIWGGPATFSADMQQINFTAAYGKDKGTTDNSVISSIDGNKIVWSDGTATTVDGQNKDYILFTDYDTNGQVEGQTRLYYSQANADAYMKKIMPAAPQPTAPTPTAPAAGSGSTTPTAPAAGSGNTTPTPKKTLPDVSGADAIIVYSNIRSDVANQLLSAFKNYSGFTSANLSTSVSCKDFGFNGNVVSSQNAYGSEIDSYVNGSKACIEADFSHSTVSGSSTVVAHYNY